MLLRKECRHTLRAELARETRASREILTWHMRAIPIASAFCFVAACISGVPAHEERDGSPGGGDPDSGREERPDAGGEE